MLTADGLFSFAIQAAEHIRDKGAEEGIKGGVTVSVEEVHIFNTKTKCQYRFAIIAEVESWQCHDVLLEGWCENFTQELKRVLGYPEINQEETVVCKPKIFIRVLIPKLGH